MSELARGVVIGGGYEIPTTILTNQGVAIGYSLNLSNDVALIYNANYPGSYTFDQFNTIAANGDFSSFRKITIVFTGVNQLTANYAFNSVAVNVGEEIVVPITASTPQVEYTISAYLDSSGNINVQVQTKNMSTGEPINGSINGAYYFIVAFK